MFESIARTCRFSASSGASVLVALMGTVFVAMPASAQAAPRLEEADSAIEWNFRPATVEAPTVSLQDRWAAPFAVQSRGQAVPREPREVVVLRDSAEARRVAAAQVAVGESAAEVTVEQGEGTEGGSEAAAEAGSAGSNAADSADAPAEANPAEAPRSHKVSRGDTLFGIARRYGVSPAAIRSVNRMTDDIVRLGQTLMIPREEASR